MSERPFRVIIVGAGPTGLYLAGALSKANIDFVVLEQYHSVVTHAGAGIIMWSHSARLLDQLGLLDEMIKCSGEFDNKTDLLQNGQVIRTNPVMGLMEKRYLRLSRALHDFETEGTCIDKDNYLVVSGIQHSHPPGVI